MRKHLVPLLVLVAIAWGGVAVALAFDITPVLGLDLKGGTSVTLRAPDGTDPEVLQKAVESLELAREVARLGNPASVSDAGVGGACGLAAAEGAALNVVINLPSLTDAKVSAEIVALQEEAMNKARKLATEVREIVDRVLADSAS